VGGLEKIEELTDKVLSLISPEIKRDVLNIDTFEDIENLNRIIKKIYEETKFEEILELKESERKLFFVNLLYKILRTHKI